MRPERWMSRRGFLIAASAMTAAVSQGAAQGVSLGELAYVDRQTLWVRDLPNGTQRAVASAHRIAWPRISPSGRWIVFQDKGSVRLTSADGRSVREWKGTGGTRVGPVFHWKEGRDELVVSKAGRSNVFSAADNWESPRGSIEPKSRYHVAGTTLSGRWLLYWKAIDEASADESVDGLELYAVRTKGGSPHRLGLKTLLYGDFIAFSPAQDIVAVTSGLGRETWERKAIALVDLTGGAPMVNVITPASMSAQLPSWSPDGRRLAWCAGPDAGALTPGSRLAAPQDVEQRCVRARRIWIADISAPQHATRLTNDPRYADEEPRWSVDGGAVLFCRTNAREWRTIWLMRPDGSQQQQIAGPLRPPPRQSELESLRDARYYGYANWSSLFDWRQS